jgi:outer membrane protein OmpA-like peptidoglycan-associated protein
MSLRVISKLSESERQALKKGVIEVSGRHMNRTALGIVDAMIQLYPKATFAELKEMMPDTLNPAAPKNYRSLFKPYTERLYGVIQPGSIRQECQEQELDINASHFTEESEIFRSADGVEILVSKTWESSDTETGQHDLQTLINHVEQYGVRVVEFVKEKPFKKGGYSLEIIDPVAFGAITNPPKKKSMVWIILLLLALIGGAAAYLVMSGGKEAPVVEGSKEVKEEPVVVVKKVEAPKDAVEQLKEDVKAGKNVENSAADLDIALGLLQELPELTIEISGHTSSEGNEGHNMTLSQKRADAVKNWLVSKGISADRMTTIGMGSTENIAENDTEENREKNRRIEFSITKSIEKK